MCFWRFDYWPLCGVAVYSDLPNVDWWVSINVTLLSFMLYSFCPAMSLITCCPWGTQISYPMLIITLLLDDCCNQPKSKSLTQFITNCFNASSTCVCFWRFDYWPLCGVAVYSDLPNVDWWVSINVTLLSSMLHSFCPAMSLIMCCRCGTQISYPIFIITSLILLDDR